MTSLLGTPVRTGSPGGEFGRRVALVLAVILVASAFAVFGASGRGALMAGFVAVLVVLSVIDIERRILPNRIVLPAAAIALAANLALAPDRAAEWFLAGLLAALLLLAAHLLHPAGMGMGDVKLALLLGVALGFSVSVALVLGILAAVPLAIVILLRQGRAGRKATIPFGPFLAFGAVVAAFYGEQLLSAYFNSSVG